LAAETIHYAILHRVATQLNTDLITGISDDAKVGVVVEGPLYDSPTDYEEARISIELYENDPFKFEDWDWVDEPVEDMLEIGNGMTWRRRFLLFGRILLVNTMENRANARLIASAIKSRVEKSLMSTDFGDLLIDGEMVTGRIFNKNIRSKIIQSGGPDSWDFEFQVRFEVNTTKVYNT
jgi:hypothetical protein